METRSRHKKSSIAIELMQEIKDRNIKNPVIREYEEEPVKRTNIEHIKELQEVLVQAAIDYIKNHELTDIDSIGFSVDGIQDSVSIGEWHPATDSWIKVCGLKNKVEERQNGEVDKFPFRYEIGTYM